MTSIGAYTTTYNCIAMQYPFEICIASLLGFADQVAVMDAGSTDGTYERLQELAKRESRLVISQSKVDFSHPRWAVLSDGEQKAKARALCTTDFLWQSDTDEVVVPEDYERIRALPEALSTYWKERPVIYLPMIEFWGSFSKVRADFLSWKPRFSINHPNITHGIPIEFRMVDRDGNENPKPFESDSCNYIWKDSRESVSMLFPRSFDDSINDPKIYEEFFNKSLELLPSVLHISWLNLARKISHYRSYWASFHASMYNIPYTDSAERNVMFDKPWSEVSDKDIVQLSEQLKASGPRFFMKKAVGPRDGLTIGFKGQVPTDLIEWCDKHKDLISVQSQI